MRLLSILALALSAAVTHVVAQTNLLQNGSFATNTFVSSGASLNNWAATNYWYRFNQSSTPTTVVTNWTYTAGATADEYTTIMPSANYTPVIRFGAGAPGPGGTMTQAFTATLGATYTASLYAGFDNDAGESVQIQILNTSDSSVVAGQTFVLSSGSSDVLSLQSFSFTATASNLTFQIKDDTGAGIGGSGDLLFANASVVQAAVPEPTTYAALVGTLTLGFAIWRRRR